MLAKAEAKHIRLSAKKARLVIHLVKGKTVEEAGSLLDHLNKGATEPLRKLLDSAFANANFNKQDKLLAKEMYVSKMTADDGPMFRRYRAATMGRASVIRHRTSHIYIELDKVVETPKKENTGS